MFSTRVVAVITLALFAFQATAAPIPGVTDGLTKPDGKIVPDTSNLVGVTPKLGSRDLLGDLIKVDNKQPTKRDGLGLVNTNIKDNHADIHRREKSLLGDLVNVNTDPKRDLLGDLADIKTNPSSKREEGGNIDIKHNYIDIDHLLGSRFIGDLVNVDPNPATKRDGLTNTNIEGNYLDIGGKPGPGPHPARDLLHNVNIEDNFIHAHKRQPGYKVIDEPAVDSLVNRDLVGDLTKGYADVAKLG